MSFSSRGIDTCDKPHLGWPCTAFNPKGQKIMFIVGKKKKSQFSARKVHLIGLSVSISVETDEETLLLEHSFEY